MNSNKTQRLHLLLITGVLLLLRIPVQAQITATNMLPCSMPPFLVTCTHVMDGRHVLAGTDGRFGVEGPDGMMTWDCLPGSFRIQAVTSKADTLIMAGRFGNVWARIGTEWERLDVPANGDVMRAWVDSGVLWLLTANGEVVRCASIRGPYTVRQAPDLGGRWRGLAVLGDTMVVVGQRGAINASVDGGTTWMNGPAPLDTLAWNTVHRSPNGTWWLTGDGARVAQMLPPFDAFRRVDTLFQPDVRDPLGAERRDGMDVITSVGDGTVIVGGRTYPTSFGRVNPDDHALFVLDSGSTTWRRIAFEFNTGIEPTVFFDIKVIGITSASDSLLTTHSTTTYNGGSFTFRHAIDLSRTSASMTRIIAGNAVERRDTSGNVRLYESARYQSLTRLDDSTIVVIREHDVLLGPVFAEPSTPEVLLVRIDPSRGRIRSMEGRGTIPCTVCTQVRSYGGSLLMGGDSGTCFISADTGQTWTSQVIDSSAGRVRDLTMQGEQLATVVGKPAGRPNRAWAYNSPLVSSDNGRRWLEPPIVIPDGQFARADFVGLAPDGTVLIAVTQFDTASLAPTQRFVRYASSTQSTEDLPLPPDLVQSKYRAVLSMLDPQICTYLIERDGDTSRAIGVWEGDAWRQFPIMLRDPLGNRRLRAVPQVNRFLATKSVFLLTLVGSSYVTGSLSEAWEPVPRLIEEESGNVLDAIAWRDGLMIVGSMGKIQFLRSSSTSSVDVETRPRSSSPINGLWVSENEQTINVTLTDIAGNSMEVALRPDHTGWASLPDGILSPGVYGVVIGSGRTVRRQTVLITR